MARANEREAGLEVAPVQARAGAAAGAADAAGRLAGRPPLLVAGVSLGVSLTRFTLVLPVTLDVDEPPDEVERTEETDRAGLGAAAPPFFLSCDGAWDRFIFD